MKIAKTLLCALTVLGLALPAAPSQAAEDIVINGSTTVLPVMQKAGEAFMASHPDIRLSLSGGGSGNGIKALIEGQCAVAMSSRDIKDKEKTAAAKNGVAPVRTAIAVDAIVPVVHPQNPTSALTLEQLRDIYTGKIVNWKDVGGADAKIVVISRDSSSGTFECWEELVMNKTRVAPAALVQASNGAVVQTVAGNKNAIGYIGLGYVDKNTKALAVNGVTASAQTAISRQWPIARELYIFTNGQPANSVAKLVQYLLDPQKGQKNVAEVGYVPLSK